MKNDVGQDIRFSCVKNSPPRKEIIQAMTVAVTTTPGSAAARSFQNRWSECSLRTRQTMKNTNAMKHPAPVSGFASKAAADAKLVNAIQIVPGQLHPAMTSARKTHAETEA
jgi:hypothetical protein